MISDALRSKVLEYQKKVNTKAWLEDIPEFGAAVDSGEVKLFDVERLAEEITAAIEALSKRDAFREGARAFREGGEFEDCPYPAGSEKWSSWKNGWETAETTEHR